MSLEEMPDNSKRDSVTFYPANFMVALSMGFGIPGG